MQLSQEIAVKENLFTFNNVLYEKLYNHKCYVTQQELKYRFFLNDDYDYVEDEDLIKKLDKHFAQI
jgi:hypothetical protein